MKRIFAIMAAVVLCFVLTVPALAVSHSDLDSNTTLDGYTCVDWFFLGGDDWGSLVCLYVPDSYTGDALPVFEAYEQSGLLWLNVCETDVDYSFGTFYYSSDRGFEFYDLINGEPVGWPVREYNPLYDCKSVIYYRGTSDVCFGEEPSGSVLGTMAGAYETSDFVLGTMRQVLSLVALVIPVVAGLFGIRKGIAFLISKIRGV